jgi:hypothetical protein
VYTGYDRLIASVRANRRPLIAVGQKHPECCGLAHRLSADGAFCLSKQKHDAQFANSLSRPRDVYTA